MFIAVLLTIQISGYTLPGSRLYQVGVTSAMQSQIMEETWTLKAIPIKLNCYVTCSLCNEDMGKSVHILLFEICFLFIHGDYLSKSTPE